MKNFLKKFSILGVVLTFIFTASCALTGNNDENTKPRLYFAQPVSAFNSQTVERLLPVIEKHFPNWHIENPNQPHHQEGYKYWKEKTGNGMNYYFKEVLPKMSGGIILPFPDGSWSAGAFGEALRLEELGHPIWKITADGIIIKTNTNSMYLWDNGILSVNQTRKLNKIPYDELLKEYNKKK